MSDQVIGVTIKGIGDFSDVVSNVGSVQKALTKLKLPDKLGDSLNKNISNFMKEYDKYQKKIAEGIHTQGDQNAVNKSLNSMLNSYEKIIKDFGKLSSKDFKEIFNLDDSAFASVQKRIKEIQTEIKKIKLDPKQLTDPINEISKLTKANSLFGNGKAFDKLKQAFASNEIQDAKEAIADIQTYYDRFSAKMSENKRIAFLDEFNKLKEYVNNADQATQKWSGDLDRLEKELGDIGGKGLGEIDEMKQKLLETSQAAERVTDVLKKQHAEEFNFNREAQNIDRQIQSYFGLSQMIRKVGDIAKDAFATVKELDKAMTQTAVVTNFSVGDMWDMLPTYTAQANQLGSTIKDVYEAATLYYQQGLNTNQAMSLANETLKMARIAGLDAADATNMMTAALRGFNMEINQTSAQKINDIYSELAAITASDTKEIGSAMERTASIANAANMDFATTSAFLAQMIETTREAPENLGTAMKTIVARFQEMKKDPTQLIDSEGVAMDANKVDTALKSIGVNLRNTKGEFRDLDDVFLDISAKWDSLTQGQQRYIATIAAGSRQQSRFIAMMSDYERTMELVDAANNSAGASQRQFEKTLDSMEAKLNMLKNAWDQFTMGLMNNQILKFGVDRLTDAFTIVNKFIDLLGGHLPDPFGGITKSVLTLVTTLGMLNFGKKASRGLIMGGAGWWKGETSLASGFAQGWKSSGQTGFFKNRKSTAEAEQQGAKDGQAYGRGWSKAVQVLQQQRRGEILGVNQIELNKIQALPVGSIIERLLPKEAITAEAAQQLQESIDAAGGNVHQGLVDYKHATGKGKILDINQGKQLQETYDSNKVKKLETNFNSLTGTIGTAGSALMNFGMILQGTPLEPFGQILTTIGGSLMSLSTAITTVKTGFLEQWAAATEAALGTTVAAGANGELAASSIIAAGGMKVLGTAIWTALWPLLAVAVAIGAVVLAAKGLDAAIETNKEQLEAATDAAAAASEAYDSAKQETSELADSIEKIRETDSAFDNLVAGTAEFNEQLVTANEQIMALIDKYPMLMESGKNYVTTDANGLMHISEEGFKAVKEYQKQIQARASAMNIIQTADLNALENQQKAKQLRNSIKTNMSEDERSKISRDADLLEQRADAEVRLARQNAIRTALSDKEIKNGEKLASIYVDQYDTQKKIAEAEVNALGAHERRQRYADYHGYTYDKATKKMKDVEGNEIDYDDAAIKDEVIEETVILNFSENAGSLEAVLNNVNKRFNSTLEDTYSNAGHFISDVLSSNIEADEDLIREVLGDNSDKLQGIVDDLSTEELETILGLTAGTITDVNLDEYKQEFLQFFKKNASSIAEAQAQSYADLGIMMAKARGWTTKQASGKGSIDTIQHYIDQLKAEQAHMMSAIGSALEEGAGTDTMARYINTMTDLYSEQTKEAKEAAEEINNILGSAKLDTAIGRLSAYTKLTKSANVRTKTLGKSFLKSTDSANLLGDAFEEFLGGDWGELSENIDNYVNGLGQIDASGVMEMAEGSAQLNTLLESGAVSAGGLALALQGVQDGQYSINAVNATVLQLLSSLTQVEDAALKAHNIIENFDPGLDYGEAEDFAKENAEKAQEFWDNGEYGNPQLQNYIKLAAGQERWNEAIKASGGDFEEAEKGLLKYVTTFKDGFQPVIDQLVAGKGIDGDSLSKNIDKALASGKIDETLAAKFRDVLPRIEGDNFLFSAEGETATELTTKEVLTYLEAIYGVSEEYAQLIFENWANLSPDLLAELKKNDFKALFQDEDFLATHQAEGVSDKIVLSDAEVETYAAARGMETDEALKELAESAGKVVETFDLIDDKGNRIDPTKNADFMDKYAKAYFNKTADTLLDQYNTDNKVDLANAVADGTARGMDENQALQAAYQAYQDYSNENAEMYYDGQLLTKEDLANFDSFYEATQQLQETSQWVGIGEAIAQGFMNFVEGKEESSGNKNKGDDTSSGTKTDKKESTVPPAVQRAEEHDRRTNTDDRYRYNPSLSMVDSGGTARDLTWKDRVPGWVPTVVEKISESAQKQAEVQEAYKNVQGQTAEELEQSKQNFLSGFNDFLNTSLNDKIEQPEGESTSDTADKLNTGSESLTEAANQLTAGIEPLSAASEGLTSAGEGLNSAAQNLTNAAAVLLTGNSSNSTSTDSSGTTNTSSGQQSSASGIVIVDNSPALASFEALQAKAEEVKTLIETPMSISIDVSDSNLTNVANQVKSINDGAGAKNISVTATSSDPAPVNTLREAIEKFNALEDHEVKLTTSLSGASVSSINSIIGAIDDFHKKGDHSVTLTVNYKTTGTKTEDHQATGSHNHGYVAPPSFGSAAGGYGQLGPKGKGGLTLTGELGYEIAWIPSENRSVILGANGPQMIDLPGDAVVWTHEQSKKMMSQKAIPAGSHFRISQANASTTTTYSTSKTVKDTAKTVSTAATTAAKAVGKVSVWWENIARQTEATQRRMDKNQKAYEKYITTINATLRKTGTTGQGDAYIKNLGKYIGYNESQVAKANQELKNLDTFKKNLKTQKQRKEVYGKAGYENIVEISYEDSKGKSQKAFADLSNYINYDKNNNTYTVSQKMLNAVSNKSMRKAIADAANKEIDDRISKRNRAQDNIDKAKEQLDKFSEELYNAFFAWETALTKIWNITQKIETATAKIGRADAMTDLLNAQLKSGSLKTNEDTAAASLRIFQQRLAEQNDIVKKRSELITESQQAVIDAYSTEDEQKELSQVQSKLKADKNAQKKINDAKAAWDKAQAKLDKKKELKAQKKELQQALKKATTEKEKKKIRNKIAKINTKLNKYASDSKLTDNINNAKAAYEAIYNENKKYLLNDTQRLGYAEYEKQLKSKMQATYKAQEFGTITRNADGTVVINFDADKLETEKLKGNISEEQAKYIEEFYTNLEESSKNLDDTINSLGEDVVEYYDTLTDLKDQWADYEEQLIQINDEKNRKELDNLQKLSDSVKQALDNLLNEVKRKLDERRKQEDNAKTERTISQKQQRLAALRADTSGGHQVEIAQLEQEIADAQQDYQRSLEDQLIDRLQNQAEEAAKQRERQIQLQEGLLTSVNNIALVDMWMANPAAYENEIRQAYREANNYEEKGAWGQKKIDTDFELFYNGLLTNQDKQVELNKSIDGLTAVLQTLTELQEKSGKSIGELTTENVNAKEMHDTYGFDYANIRSESGYTAEQFAESGVTYQNAREAFSASELSAVEDYEEEAFGELQNDYTTKLNNVKKNKKITTNDINKLFTFGKDINRSKAQVIMDIVTKDQFTDLDPFTWKNTIKELIKADGITRYNLVKTWPNNKYLAAAIKLLSGKTHPNTIAGITKHKNYKNAKDLHKVYKTGGLADYTGPAWLDGTPSKPELVLNAKDTANFIALKDVLAKAMNNIGDTSNTYGDIMYEININVDKIEKDYDVDRVVDKVKKEIIKGAGYRNVTQVRNFR